MAWLSAATGHRCGAAACQSAAPRSSTAAGVHLPGDHSRHAARNTCVSPAPCRYCLRLLPSLITCFCQCIVVYSGQPTRRLPVGRASVAASGARPDWNPAGPVKGGTSERVAASRNAKGSGRACAPALRRGRLVEVSNAERWLAAVPKGRARPCLTSARFALRPFLLLALQETRVTRCLPGWPDARSALRLQAYRRCGSRAIGSHWRTSGR